MTPGWRFERRDDDQLLVAGEGVGASETIEVRFPVHTANLTKEYELFAEFTDGSVALYTGHFHVATEEPAASDAGDEAEFLRRVELVPAAGERVVVQGVATRGPTVWGGAHVDGTYAYVGTIEPLETDSMIALLDPGAPPWLLERMRDLLPAFFAEYADRFGEALPWKPMVLFSFHDLEVSGLQSGGGTLTGLIQMSVTGGAWREATPDSSEHLVHLIAHEAAHLWNGQIHAYGDPADSWMHEGSADALANALLLRHGAIDEARLSERRTEAINLCARGLRDGSLSTAGERRRFSDYYACGSTIAIWSAAATSAEDAPDRLFEIWRRLFEISASAGGDYDRQTYFSALRELGASAESTARLEAFIDTHHTDPVGALGELFSSVGIELERPERPAESLRRSWAATALQHLMAAACDGRYSFQHEGLRLRTAPMEGCGPFQRELRVVAIEGHPVRQEGDLALAAARRRCERQQPVSLELESEPPAHVPCPSPPPVEPAPLAFPRPSGAS